MAFRLLLRLGTEPSLMLVWLALLLTYCVHAALGAVVAGLLARRTAAAATKNALWKLALFGPLVTAALSTVLSFGPAWSLERSQPSTAVAAQTGLGDTRVFDGVLPPWAAQGSAASQLFGALLIAALCVGLGRFGASVVALRRALDGRVGVRDPRLLARFEHLRTRAALPQVRLSESQHLPGPVIVGWREICVPSGQLVSCSEGELDAIFAHELAHIERRDGLWFPLVGLVEAVLWLQPFNRRVANLYRQSAELACDDRAVQLTGAPFELARALTRMAEASMTARMGMLTAGMASSPHLPRLERVRRLLAEPGAAPRRAGWPALACLGVLGIASPSLSVEREPSAVPAARVHAAPDFASYEATMQKLSAEAEQFEAQLAHVPASAPARTLELQQALRHVRATQAWTEHQLEADQSVWEYESRHQPD